MNSEIIGMLALLGFQGDGLTKPTVSLSGQTPAIRGGNLRFKAGKIVVVIGKKSITVRSPGLLGGRSSRSFKFDQSADLQSYLQTQVVATTFIKGK